MYFRSLWKKINAVKKPYLLYGAITLGFVVWMSFLDTHSWTIHRELNQEIDQLENEKKVLQKIIQEDKKNIEVLHNEDSLERYARENYGHKKNNETIFIIENQDGLK